MAKVVQIRDVPDEVHAALTEQAEQAGLSLNRYVLGEFERLAQQRRNAEIFADAAREDGPRPSLEQIVGAIREDRDRDG